MPFHLLQYQKTAGINDANVDMLAITDPVYSQRNNHFIFTEQYRLLGAMYLAAHALRARFNIPSWNTYSRHHVWPIGQSATPQSFPRLADYRNLNLMLPLNEEIAVEESNNLCAATEETTVSLWLADQSWKRTLPTGLFANTLRLTSACVRIAKSWSGLFAVTFSDSTPKGGWYAVTGAWMQTSTCRAFRMFFPRAPLTSGRIMRPGSYVSNALGNMEAPYWNDAMGVWGVFHTFEPPQVEVYADAAGADTQELRLNCVFLGDGPAGAPPAF